MKVLEAAAGAGAWVELLAEPNRLGAGVVEEDDVVVVAAALLDMKENAGFEAAAESGALCPKVKEGLGFSGAEFSLLSAGLPKVNVGADCSLGASGLLNEKTPKVAGAGVVSASLLAAPNRKAEGAEEVASFFSSGFPKVNVGAAGSFSVDPKVEPPSGVVDKLGSPSLPNTDPAVVVVVVVLADVVSADDTALSLFS